MDQSRLALGNGEDNVGIPDDLRCKRSDGKQWRCTAMSMPDKTVCEKHYIQAKKRAANSAMRVNLKKAKRRSLGESDIFLESKSDDLDVPLASVKSQERKYMEKVSKNHFRYSLERLLVKGSSVRNPSKLMDEIDLEEYEENWRSNSNKSLPASALDSSRNRPQRSFDVNAMTVLTLMEAQNPLKKLVAKLAISVGGMTETQSFGASNVIEEDTVTAVFRHGTRTSH